MVQINRLQSVPNSIARTIYREDRTCHITPILKDLHWLRVGERIEFKVCLTVFKSLHSMAPEYVSELCLGEVVVARRLTLRSAMNEDPGRLNVPIRANRPGYLDRSFAVAGPLLWNRLPPSLRAVESIDIFKRQLKAHLCVKCYSS